MSAERHAWCTRCQEPVDDAGVPACICPRLWPVLAAAPEQLALAIDVPRVERAKAEDSLGTLIALCSWLLDEHGDDQADDIPHEYGGRPVFTVITGGGVL